MPNHVHIIIVPSDEDGLRRTFADTHRRYTGFINARHRQAIPLPLIISASSSSCYRGWSRYPWRLSAPRS
jgi:REP element-mobilizing transposase RayT